MSYREAMCDLSDLAKDGPAYVRVQALVTIVRETSPNNARHGDVMRELGLADELPGASSSGCANCGDGTKAQESLRILREEARAEREAARAGREAEEGEADEEDPH